MGGRGRPKRNADKSHNMDLRIDGRLPGKGPNKSPLVVMIDGERKTPMQMQRGEEQQNVGNQNSIDAVKDGRR